MSTKVNTDPSEKTADSRRFLLWKLCASASLRDLFSVESTFANGGPVSGKREAPVQCSKEVLLAESDECHISVINRAEGDTAATIVG
jgi:hypothetical protein